VLTKAKRGLLYWCASKAQWREIQARLGAPALYCLILSALLDLYRDSYALVKVEAVVQPFLELTFQFGLKHGDREFIRRLL